MTKIDVYTRITNKIIADLEKGVRPWEKPWLDGGTAQRPLRSNGQPYRGINVLMLWDAALTNGYASPIWMSYKQAQELGGQVRKGERGTEVVYANVAVKTLKDEETGKELEQHIPFLRCYTVFNVDQIDGLPPHYSYKPEPVLLPAKERSQQLEMYFSNTRADIRYGGNSAFYAIAADFIQMPPFDVFLDAERYYATLGHETIHWTRHESRLNRDFGRKRWGDAAYAQEELVAELGAAFLCADLQITPEVRDDHTAYIASWLNVLQRDKRAIFTAAAHAQRAVEFLHGLQPGQTVQSGANENIAEPMAA